MDSNIRKIGIASFLSYAIVIINTICILFLAPYIVTKVGKTQYGIYKIVTSFTASFTILDFGIGQTIVRFIAKYKAENKNELISRVSSQFVRLIIFIDIIVFFFIIAGKIIFTQIYGIRLNTYELELASKLYNIAALQLLLVIIENGASGFIAGLEGYIAVNSIKFLSVLLKYICEFTVLQFREDMEVIVTVEAVIVLLRLSMDIMYLCGKKHFKVVWGKLDVALIKIISAYAGIIFLNSIVDQLNSNVDNLVIGAVVGSEAVAVYSFGQQIFYMFEQISMSIATVMLPVVINLVVNSRDKEVQEAIVSAGSVQFIFLGAVFVAFFLFGKEFIILWLGKGYEDVWIITLFLMLGGIIPYSLNVTVSVLRAMNCMVFRTAALLISAVLNAVLTYFFVKRYNYVYAAVVTSVTFILINTIVMNVYYRIRLGYDMLGIIMKIIRRPLFCLFIAGAFSYLFLMNIPTGWLFLIIKVAIFVVVYLLLIYIAIYKKGRFGCCHFGK